ncbi:MAG TPA: hypothetical protein VFE84_04485, partial [Patescibacteria group bacterium]|nr:hypothetical protein [Patescibacteria group bacterium]
MPDGRPVNRTFDPARPPRIDRWPDATHGTRGLRAWFGTGGCTAIVQPGVAGELDRYRGLLDPSDKGPDARWRPSVRVVEAEKATRADLAGPLLVVGPVGPLVSAYLDRTPFPQAGAILTSMRSDDTIRVTGVNPWAPESPMIVISGSSDAAVLGFLERSEWLRAPDYELVRNGMRVRYGRYTAAKEGAWGVDASTDVDLRSRLAWVEDSGVRAVYVEGEIEEARARVVASRAAVDLESYLRRLGGTSEAAHVELVLYPDLEAKSVRSDDPRWSHLEAATSRMPRVHRVHMVAPTGNEEPDRIGLARAALRLAAGDVSPRALADGAAVWLAGGMMGHSLDWWAGRLTASGVLPSADDLFDESRYRDRTYLVGIPAAAMMMTRLSAGRSPSEISTLLRDPVRARTLARATEQRVPSPPPGPGNPSTR